VPVAVAAVDLPALRPISRATSFGTSSWGVSFASVVEEEEEQPISSVPEAEAAVGPAYLEPAQDAPLPQIKTIRPATTSTDLIHRSPTAVFNGRAIPAHLFILRTLLPAGAPQNILLGFIFPAALFVIQLYIAVCSTVLHETEGALHRLQKSMSVREEDIEPDRTRSRSKERERQD